jgi:hypothetical protein
MAWYMRNPSVLERYLLSLDEIAASYPKPNGEEAERRSKSPYNPHAEDVYLIVLTNSQAK